MSAENANKLQELKAKIRTQLRRNPNSEVIVTTENACMLLQDATTVQCDVNGLPVIGSYDQGVWTFTSGL